tara:strand:+ start:573 stop:785 length:213 start_codon:yes stop_codon:yes gene_type:complete
VPHTFLAHLYLSRELMLGEFVKTNARLDALPLLVARLDALEHKQGLRSEALELKLEREIDYLSSTSRGYG